MTPHAFTWGRWVVARIARREPGLQRLTGEELATRARELRHRARCGEPLSKLVPPVFALVREVSRRELGLRPYDVQILGGLALFRGGIAEMQPGEGKTLTAVLPLFLHALLGRGAHLVTANPYLARRDADWMRPVFERMGMRVGLVLPESTPQERRTAYACDVTYGTVSEFGFDFLRDRLSSASAPACMAPLFGDFAPRTGLPIVQREPWFALVDEADSVLIDDAGTPLIIGLPDAEESEHGPAARWSAEAAGHFRSGVDFRVPQPGQRPELTETGRARARGLPKPEQLASASLFEIYESLERAIAVDRNYESNRQYVVRDGEVAIIDENTGRVAEGRSWRGGIHQAVEAREGLALTARTEVAAGVTVQSYFRRYPHLAGLTATARTSAAEFRRIYRLRVSVIPPHRRSRRRQLPTLAFGTLREKLEAIVDEVKAMHGTGRPVLVGTRSIRDSEMLSAALKRAGLEHVVLNALRPADEAGIVAGAGAARRITVATNMAGRGTDIRLTDESRGVGGLHVVATELHDSVRVDRQLYGRCGRQGEPGSFRQFLSGEDRLLREALTEDERAALARGGTDWQSVRRGPRCAKRFARVQRRLERRRYRQRRLLVHLDERRMQRADELGLDGYLEAVEW